MARIDQLSMFFVLQVLLSAMVGAQELNPQQLEKHVRYTEYALANPGDAQRGQQLFEQHRQLACANCHVINGIEKSGPNLDGIADKYPPKDLIVHILNPNAFIQPGYETVNILTDQGEVLTGRVRLSTKLEVRLLMADGRLKSVKRANIDELKSSPVSMMPSNLVDSVSQAEFADLIAYLSTLHSAELNAWKGPGQSVQIIKSALPVELTAIHPPELKFNNPVWVCEIPGHVGQLIILEHQQGIAWRLDTTTSPPTRHVFLDLANEISYSANQGLMCLAFHPNFANNGRYFVKYEVGQPGGVILTTINERQATSDHLADSGTASRRLLEQSQPAFNHNGGCLAFGPDGMLYIAFGDGGPQEDPPGYSQNPRIFHGSILRIDVDNPQTGKPYAIPPDNPFLHLLARDRSIRPELWAIGFREPWRFSFDSLTGDLWVGDVGQVKYEEVCLVQKGQNHGWNVYEGFDGFSEKYRRRGEAYTNPLLAYPRSMGVSVTGGYVYRGDPQSSYYGRYIFGDYESRRIWALQQVDNELVSLEEIGTSPEHIASFGVDAAGHIYLVGYEGTVFQLGL
ncbi:MAG: PQQ-dependent sugar dehydrogenase [Planctomycetales bacterium]|nr:PQQ-dependent sugar dehydrogenase [Planctomycetales bacterium]